MLLDVAKFTESTTIECNWSDCDWSVGVVAPMSLDLVVNEVWRHWVAKHNAVPPSARGGGNHEQKDPAA